MAKKKREMKRSFADHLPEPIKQHILSFLPEKVAAKTSILSKAWLNAWRTKPNLEFDSGLFFENFEEEDQIEERCQEFSKYVNRTLKRYTQQKISIEKLKLDLISTGDIFSNSQADSLVTSRFTQQKISIETLKLNANRDGESSPVDSLVQRCTRVAVERGVKNLCLSTDYESADCELPQIIAGAKSLVDLSLIGFDMVPLSAEKIMWHSLKRLCLNMVCFDESMFENIFSICPLLEILEISYPEFNDNNQQNYFKVMEHHNLKRLTVRLSMFQNLILAEAPKLESLICTCKGYDAPCGLSLHSSQYQNLRMLNLCGVAIADDFFNNFEQKFPVLQELLVRSCKDLRRIKISSQTLERIQLAENYGLEEAHFDVPSIERLDYICYDCEIIPEFSFTTATKHHWISNLRIHWSGNVDSCWFLQLKKFLVNLIPSSIILHIGIGGSIELDMNEIRNSSTCREPLELQELSLSLSPGLDSSSLLSTLDRFFSIGNVVRSQ